MGRSEADAGNAMGLPKYINSLEIS